MPSLRLSLASFEGLEFVNLSLIPCKQECTTYSIAELYSFKDNEVDPGSHAALLTHIHLGHYSKQLDRNNEDSHACLLLDDRHEPRSLILPTIMSDHSSFVLQFASAKSLASKICRFIMG